MRSSHTTLLRRSCACGATIGALSLTSGPTAHAATPVAKEQCPSLDVALTASNLDAIRAGILCIHPGVPKDAGVGATFTSDFGVKR